MENKIRIKDLRPELRPDEKLLESGPKALSDAELLAVIIRTGSPKESSVKVCEHIISSKADGSLSILNIFEKDFNELIKIDGVGKVKALQIKALQELSLRISKSRAAKKLILSSPSSISDYYMEEMRHLKREVVMLLMLSCSCELIKDEIISEGTATSALFSPREIFLEALKYGAVSIVLLHNHPSGLSRPNREDILGTKRVFQAGKLIGIELLDHIIIGDNEYTSLKEEGFLNDGC